MKPEAVSTRRRTPGIFASQAPRGPNGERLCRNCKGPMPKGARHNCSRKCSDEWMCKTSPSHMRYRLFERDHGVCGRCGVDTEAQKKAAWDRINALHHAKPQHYYRSDYAEIIAEYGVPPSRATGDWWDADHIKPVIEGGGECGIENFRTLCVPCHKRVTKELAARLAARRHEQRGVQKDESRGLFASL